MRIQSLIFPAVIALAMLSPAAHAAQLQIGMRPFTAQPVFVSLDIYPVALSWEPRGAIAFWHGPAFSVFFDTNHTEFSLSYGMAFFSHVSASAFLGAVYNPSTHDIGLSLRLTQTIVAFPVSITIQRIGSPPRGMLFGVGLSAGIGVPYPLVRKYNNRFFWFFEQAAQ